MPTERGKTASLQWVAGAMSKAFCKPDGTVLGNALWDG